MLKNILDVSGAAIAFYTIGFALAFGGDDPAKGFTFVGTQDFFVSGDDIDLAFFFFEFSFAAAAATSTYFFLPATNTLIGCGRLLILLGFLSSYSRRWDCR